MRNLSKAWAVKLMEIHDYRREYSFRRRKPYLITLLKFFEGIIEHLGSRIPTMCVYIFISVLLWRSNIILNNFSGLFVYCFLVEFKYQISGVWSRFLCGSFWKLSCRCHQRHLLSTLWVALTSGLSDSFKPHWWAFSVWGHQFNLIWNMLEFPAPSFCFYDLPRCQGKVVTLWC